MQILCLQHLVLELDRGYSTFEENVPHELEVEGLMLTWRKAFLLHSSPSFIHPYLDAIVSEKAYLAVPRAARCG